MQYGSSAPRGIKSLKNNIKKIQAQLKPIPTLKNTPQ